MEGILFTFYIFFLRLGILLKGKAQTEPKPNLHKKTKDLNNGTIKHKLLGPSTQKEKPSKKKPDKHHHVFERLALNGHASGRN